MNEELGAVVKTVKCPEKVAAQAPLWRDILVNLLPILVVGIMLRALSIGGGMNPGGATIIALAIVAVFTFFSVYVTRSWKKRYAELFLQIHENGLSGKAPANAFSSRDFAFPYSDLQTAQGKKLRLTLRTRSASYTLITDEAEALAAELNQHVG